MAFLKFAEAGDAFLAGGFVRRAQLQSGAQLHHGGLAAAPLPAVILAHEVIALAGHAGQIQMMVGRGS
ncbi:MAG: hypothetical protein IPK82_23465 [Polyangiaceae bacterium]|nr:hypothetical protein [Polyangiaceae bacterium]